MMFIITNIYLFFKKTPDLVIALQGELVIAQQRQSSWTQSPFQLLLAPFMIWLGFWKIIAARLYKPKLSSTNKELIDTMKQAIKFQEKLIVLAAKAEHKVKPIPMGGWGTMTTKRFQQKVQGKPHLKLKKYKLHLQALMIPSLIVMRLYF